MSLPLSERARSALLVGAVGDALGGSVEFDSLERIRARYGPDGIRDLDDRGYGVMGAITDDTRMTPFTAEGLLRAEQRGIRHPPSVVHHAYLRWLLTRGEPARCEVGTDG